MKDKNGLELKIGDYIIDHTQDLSRIVEFLNDGKPDECLITKPFKSQYAIWSIYPRQATKIDKIDVIPLLLKGLYHVR